MSCLDQRGQEELDRIIRDSVKNVFSPLAQILKIEELPINRGYQTVEIFRHKVIVQDQDGKRDLFLITKKAQLIERRVFSLLASQGANVPPNFIYDLQTNTPAFICMQDIDQNTDYQSLDIEMILKKEPEILAHIHQSNRGLSKELAWLPVADKNYVLTMLNTRWKPYWEKALENEEFVESFASYIPEVQAVAGKIIDDMEIVIKDEDSHTLIHTDLHPGNVLVQNNEKIFYIDWEETHYGSFYFDVAHRFNNLKLLENYRHILSSSFGIEHKYFMEHYKIASRYTGLRYMAWTLGAWAENHKNTKQLYHYLNMVVN